MKKAIIAIVVIIVVILLALYFRNGGMTAASDDSSFEQDAAAILAAGIPAQQKIDALNANLQARLQARQARAAKSGATVRTIPGVTTR